jgi:hypothetical protein
MSCTISGAGLLRNSSSRPLVLVVLVLESVAVSVDTGDSSCRVDNASDGYDDVVNAAASENDRLFITLCFDKFF